MAQKEETKAVLLRVPLDVKRWIENEAAPTLASQNSVILRCIRAEMDTRQQTKTSAG